MHCFLPLRYYQSCLLSLKNEHRKRSELQSQVCSRTRMSRFESLLSLGEIAYFQAFIFYKDSFIEQISEWLRAFSMPNSALGN